MQAKFSSKLSAFSKVFEASIISFIAILALAIYDFVLPIFTEERAGSFAIVGVIISLIYVASLIAEVPVGLGVDKYGRIKVLLVSMVAMGLIGLVYFLTENLTLLAVLSLVFGIISVAFWIPSAVLIRDYSPHKMLSQAEGVYMSLTQLGWIFGPILAGLIGTVFSDKHNFLMMSLFMFVAVGLGVIIFRGIKAKNFRRAEKGHKHKSKLTLLTTVFREYIGIHKHAAPLYALTLSAYIWIAVEWAFVAIAGMNYFGFSEGGVGLILGAMMAVEGLLYYSSGFMMDKIGKKYIITAGFFMLFASAYFMFLATNPAIFIFAALIGAASVSWILPGTEALLTEIVPANLYGEMSGVFDTSKDFGMIFGPLLGGALATFLVNPLAPFLLVAVFAGSATLLSGWVFWPEKKHGK
jgi:MFS family permease